MREVPAMGRGDNLAAGDAAGARQARSNYIKCQHQCVREGPTVDRSDEPAPGDAAAAHEGR